MDPLSMTASIIAILQLTTSLTGYITAVMKATTEQKRLAVEASNLCSLLTSLRFRVEAARPDDPWFSQVKMLGAQNGPLEQLKDILEKMVEQISSSGKRHQIKSAVLWKFTKTDMENALTRIERLKSLITCALTNDLLTLSQVIHGDIVALGKQTEKIHIGVGQLQTYADQGLRDTLSKWLGLPDPSTNYHAALKKHHVGTGAWLLSSQHFEKWKTSGPSLMWLHGNAGCGKTVLSTALLQNIKEHQESQPNTVVGYFYFDFREAEKQSSAKAIRTLLFQFALRNHDCLQGLEKMHQKCQQGAQQPAEAELRLLLTSVIACIEHKYIVLDALDECEDREDLLTFLDELVNAKQQSIHILATSRHVRDIEEQLDPIATQNINIQSTVVDKDIRLFVHDKLTTDPKLKKWSAAVHEEITAVMMKKAGGMFRWAFLQYQSLRKCVTLKALENTLSSLPADLDETYDRMIQHLRSANHFQDAVQALQWLCFSSRPLGLSEMVEILAITTGDNGGFSPAYRLPDPADIMVICSNLISFENIDNNGDELLNDDSDELLDDESVEDSSVDTSFHAGSTNPVRLAHFSVQEYLLSDKCALQADLQMQNCHKLITEGCLRYLHYLSGKAPLTQEILDEHPLAYYAAEYWWQHAQKIEGIIGDAVLDLTLKLLMNENDALLSWLQVYDIDYPDSKVGLSLTRDKLFQPLYYAAYIGVPEVVQKILQYTTDINADGGFFGNALQAASFYGHDKVVQMLLDAGADVDIEGGHYNFALIAGSTNGHEKVIPLLLDSGADINARGPWCGTALHTASGIGHDKVVQLLLAREADVNAQDKSHDNALKAASRGSHKKIVQMLLDAGANVNAQGGYDDSALRAASGQGNEKIVQILLDAGANVNVQGHSSSALRAASYKGNEKIVQMLLDAGADVNALAEEVTALQAASFKGHERIVQMLLDAGADVNALAKEDTALQAASFEGHEKIVQLLLDAGANVNVQGHGGSALQAASEWGDEKIVQMLLDAGADVNALGEEGTALQAASCKGYEKIVQMLLDAGANVNAQEEYFGGALYTASFMGYEEIVHMLLDAGANVNAQGGYYGSALRAASLKGREKIVQMLLDARADVNALGEDGTALQAASKEGHEKIVQILLDAGADVNVQERYYGSALQAASKNGHEKVVQMLLEAGAEATGSTKTLTLGLESE